MKKLMSLVLVAALLVMGVLADKSYAQQATAGTPVTQTGIRADAATRCDSAVGAGQQTLTTQNPGPGLSNYLTVIAIWSMASGVSGAATPTVATMTGVAGSSPSLTPLPSVFPAAAAQGVVGGGPVPMATPIKCLTSTACAIVGPTAITNTSQAVEACYYVAP